MSSHHRKPAGHVQVPLYIFSFVALFLGIATELMGVFGGLNHSLRNAWERGGVEFHAVEGLPGTVGVLLSAFAIFGLVGAILTAPGATRRVILGVSALALTAALLPVFAVWGIFWKPFGMALGVCWGWFSAYLYAHTHRMPCEGVVAVAAENVIPLNEERPVEARSQRADG